MNPSIIHLSSIYHPSIHVFIYLSNNHLLKSIHILVFISLDPGLHLIDVHRPPDDLIVVGELVTGGELVEGFGEDTAVGVLVLVNNLDRKIDSDLER